MEDVSIAKLLKHKLQLIPIDVKTSARKYQNEGWIKRSIKNIILVLKFKFGADPEKLAKSYK